MLEIRTMRWRTWRNHEGLTIEEMAQKIASLLGCEPIGVRTAQRWETGENVAPAEVVEAVRVMTKGQVSPIDIHDQRLEWLHERGRTGPRVKLVQVSAA